MSERPKNGSGGFFLLWAYLMFLSIMLAPVLAQVVRSILAGTF